VVGCVLYCSTELTAPGVVRHIEGTRFTIGEPDGSVSERCRAISQAFVAAVIELADLLGEDVPQTRAIDACVRALSAARDLRSPPVAVSAERGS
jgi:ketopantoate reductase